MFFKSQDINMSIDKKMKMMVECIATLYTFFFFFFFFRIPIVLHIEMKV